VIRVGLHVDVEKVVRRVLLVDPVSLAIRVGYHVDVEKVVLRVLLVCHVIRVGLHVDVEKVVRRVLLVCHVIYVGHHVDVEKVVRLVGLVSLVGHHVDVQRVAPTLGAAVEIYPVVNHPVRDALINLVAPLSAAHHPVKSVPMPQLLTNIKSSFPCHPHFTLPGTQLPWISMVSRALL